MPNGIHQSISVHSSNSIDSKGVMSYENGDIETGKTYFEIEALHGNLSEYVKDYSKRIPESVASTSVKGNFSLLNELEDSYRTSCAAAVLLEKMDSVELLGEKGKIDYQLDFPPTIIMEGKEASGATQASYLLRDASDLINDARTKDTTSAMETYEKAIMLAEKALELDPENSNGWTINGIALMGVNRIEDAEKAYDKAVKLNPDNTKAIFGKAEALFAMGQYRRSLENYDLGLTLSPNENAAYWFNEADAHDKLNETDAAIASIDQYISRKGEDLGAHLFKAELLYKKGNYHGAISLWVEYLPKSPSGNLRDLGIYYYYQGLTYEKVNEWDRAEASFEMAKTLDETLTEDADIEIAKCKTHLNGSAVSNPLANAGTNSSSLANG